MGPDWLSIPLLGLLSLQSTCFVFDSEEIKALNFVVDILDQPVLLSETPEERTVQMYNRAGQVYSCLLPDTEPLLQQRRQEAEAIQHGSVPSLLAPMTSGPCLQRTRDWWTYELCPMSEIRQYHMEGGQIVGQISVLGRFESDFDWSRDDGRSRNAKQRYHSQMYGNGSDCDLTGRPRSAEVRYMCEEGEDDALVRVDEPETCRYVLTVRTARLCSHRLLAPPPGRRPQPVTCRPALSDQQMQRLAVARIERGRREAERAARWVEDRKRADAEAEEVKEERRKLEEEEEEEEVEKERREQEGEEGGGRSAGETKDLLKEANYLFDIMADHTKKLGSILDEVLDSYIDIVSEFDSETEYDVERLHALQERHLAARHQHAEHARRIGVLFGLATTEGRFLTHQIVRDLIAYLETLTDFSDVMLGIVDESHRLEEFMSSDPSMVTEHMVTQLVKTKVIITSLSGQLNAFFTEIKEMEGFLRSWQANVKATLVSKARSEDQTQTQDRDSTSDQTDGPRAERASGGGTEQPRDSTDSGDFETLGLLTSRPKERRPSSAEDSPVSSEDSAEDQSEEEEDELSGAEGEDGTTAVSKKVGAKFPALRALGLDKMVQITEIDREQRARVERAVKQKLGKVGLDTNGPEIKVRFLKFPDLNRLDQEHTLSDDELAAFENALITLMMGGNEAMVEHDKHSQQAKNYEFSFDTVVQQLETNQDEEPADESPAIDESLFTLV